MDVVVIQEGSAVTFKFERPGLITKAIRIRVFTNDVSVGSSTNQVLWEVANDTTKKGFRTINYGILPQGFSQLTPKDGVPPPLQEGERYYVAAESEDGTRGWSVFRLRSSIRGQTVRIDEDPKQPK